MIDIEGIKARLDIAENGIKCAEQAIENAKACFDKAKEMLDAKDAKPPRNWPERIEAGMCFRWGRGLTYIYVQGGTLANIESGETFDAHLGFNGRERDFTYLGHARDILTIRTDAHEPTGAELVGTACEPTGVDLVGKRCRVSLSQIHHALDGVEATVIHYKNGFGYATEEGEGQRWTFARLAK